MEMKDIIKPRREELNLTQKEVADFVGVSEATISRWESGEIKNLRRDRISALAKILNLSPSTIVGELEEEVLPEDSNSILKISNLSPTLLEKLERFLELAEENPDSAERFLSFAVQELGSSKEAQ